MIKSSLYADQEERALMEMLNDIHAATDKYSYDSDAAAPSKKITICTSYLKTKRKLIGLYITQFDLPIASRNTFEKEKKALESELKIQLKT
jgi:hypothetical protein